MANTPIPHRNFPNANSGSDPSSSAMDRRTIWRSKGRCGHTETFNSVRCLPKSRLSFDRQIIFSLRHPRRRGRSFRYFLLVFLFSQGKGLKVVTSRDDADVDGLRLASVNGFHVLCPSTHSRRELLLSKFLDLQLACQIAL